MSRALQNFPSALIAACFAAVMVLSACKDTSTSHSSTTQQNAGLADSSTSQQSRDSAYVSGQDADAGLTLTLPMLDALFVEESFEQDLRSKLLLTDEQIHR